MLNFLLKKQILVDVQILGTLICENLHSLYRFQRETLNQLKLIQIHHHAMQELIKANLCDEDKHKLFSYPHSAFPIGCHCSRLNAIKFFFSQIEFVAVEEKKKANAATRINYLKKELDTVLEHTSTFNADQERVLNERQSTKRRKSEVGKPKIKFIYSCHNEQIDKHPKCKKLYHYQNRGSCVNHLQVVHGKSEAEAIEECDQQEHEQREHHAQAQAVEELQ
jgi:hypothetical protein